MRSLEDEFIGQGQTAFMVCQLAPSQQIFGLLVLRRKNAYAS
jgi:hypothetical protein